MRRSGGVHEELGRLTLVLAAAAALIVEALGLMAGDGPEQALLKASVALMGMGLMGGVLGLVMGQQWGPPPPTQVEAQAAPPQVEVSARQGEPARPAGGPVEGELAAND